MSASHTRLKLHRFLTYREKGETKMKSRAVFLILFLAISIAATTQTEYRAFAATAKLRINPPQIANETLTPSHEFTVNIEVADVVDLFAYEFKAYFNNSVLNCTKAVRPVGHFLEPLIDPGNQFIPKWEIKNDFNATHGRAWLGFTLLAPEVAKTGSGILVIITFRVQGLGVTPLSMRDTKLADSAGISIAHDAENGSFSNLAQPPPPPRPKIYVDPKELIDESLGPSHNFTISVKIANATQVYSFAFRLDFAATVIEAIEVLEGEFLKSAGPTTILVSEINNTAGFVELSVTLNNPPSADGDGTLGTIMFHVVNNGTSTLNLSITSLKDADDTSLDPITANGRFSNVVLNGDLNGDGKVDIYDLVTVAIAFGATPENQRWNPAADLNGEGIIDIFDIMLWVIAYYIG